jgi:branched-chain amino acid transport system substrate-binding protein
LPRTVPAQDAIVSLAERRRAGYAHLATAAALLLVVAVAAAGGSSPAPRQVDAAASGASAAGIGGDRGGEGGGDVAGDQGAAGGDGAAPGTAGGARPGGPAPRAGGPNTSAGTNRPRSYPPGVTDTTIRIGGSTFTSGPAAVYGEQIAVGFAAGIRYVNEHGGINGRRVELVLYDDGGDPAKQLTNTKRLVEVDKVFALSMMYAPIAGQYVAEQRIPVMHQGQFDEEFTHPWWFPVGGPQRFAAYSTAWFGATKLKVKKVAIFYLDAGAVNYSREFAEKEAQDWKAYGVSVPVLAPFAPDQTSCGDALSQARDAEVDFIVFEIDAAKVIKCGVEAQLQGYTPPKGWGGYLIGVPVIPEALGDFSLGMYAFDAFGALYEVPEYVEYVKKVSSSTEAVSSVTASYFTLALLFRDAVAKLGDNITREGLRNVLNTFTDWRPDITSDPNMPTWTWTPTCHVALRGGYVIQVQKHDGENRWTQITPQFTATQLPPGREPPPEYASCAHAFSRS